jgi:hypothetical protein
MDLIPNGCFRVQASPLTPPSLDAGVYRVILDDPVGDITIAVLILADEENRRIRGGRNKKGEAEMKHKRRKAPPSLVGELRWLRRSELLALSTEGLVRPFEIARHPLRPLSKDSQLVFERRQRAMSSFLNLKTLQEWISIHRSLKALVAHVVATASPHRLRHRVLDNRP